MLISNDEFYSILVAVAKEMSKYPKKRNLILLFSLVFLISSVSLAFTFRESSQVTFIISVILAMASGIVFLTAVLSFASKDVKTISEKFEQISTERERLVKKTEADGNILDVIRLNLNQLDEYYTINKVQAKKSYSFSIITIVIGIFTIIFAVAYLMYINKLSEIVIITALSGLLLEFIGATSLVLYKESTKSIASFYNKLSYLQHIMLAVELSGKLSEENKDKEISNIIAALINIKGKE